MIEFAKRLTKRDIVIDGLQQLSDPLQVRKEMGRKQGSAG